MAKVNKLRLKSDPKCSGTQFPSSCSTRKICKDLHSKKKSVRASEKKDWEDARCSVCMESPHKAVLLLCSSYSKGCRPYMCDTSNRYSNCLDLYKKFYTKETSIQNSHHRNDMLNNLRSISGAGKLTENAEVPELLCPLCRRHVKGWTVVEPARKYLNAKKRSCMQDTCSFVGSYKELRKHVMAKHPLSRPQVVDPVLEEKWKMFECERERDDVISSILTSTPEARFFGDYVIEPGPSSLYSDDYSDLDEYLDNFHRLPFNLGLNDGIFSRSRYHGDYDSFNEDTFRTHCAAVYDYAAASGSGVRRNRILVVPRRRLRRRRGRNGNR